MRRTWETLHWSALALSVALGLPGLAAASEQSDSKGFIDDSSLNLLNRNLFWQQSAQNAHQRDWSQALMLNYSSGFTQGTVGFGVDAFATWRSNSTAAPAAPARPTCPSTMTATPRATTARPAAT
ncbi:MAG: Porin D [Pseudomonas citronellolis]|nr:MAG: Porin D [Pseudomonas citronellolis]